MKKNHIRVPQCSTCGAGILGVIWHGQQCVGCAIADVRLAESPEARAVVAAPEGSFPAPMVERMRNALAKAGKAYETMTAATITAGEAYERLMVAAVKNVGPVVDLGPVPEDMGSAFAAAARSIGAQSERAYSAPAEPLHFTERDLATVAGYAVERATEEDRKERAARTQVVSVEPGRDRLVIHLGRVLATPRE